MQLSRPDLVPQKAYINGEWVSAKSGKTFPVTNKATGEEIAQVPDMNHEDTKDAINAANEAFQPWSKRTPKERHDLLRALFNKINENFDDLARIIVMENGKTMDDAKGEVAYANSYIEWFAAEAMRIYGYTTPSEIPTVRNLVQKHPVGVVGIVTPWNFPLAMHTRKVGPAFAAGCTVVLKAPAETPLSAFAFARLCEEVGIPKGVFNVVVSTKGENEASIGQELCANELVRKISFTGSTRVGKLLMKQSADTLKKLSMELGGNAPFIVFDDADFELAMDQVLNAKFRGSGQACIAANRIYVHEKIFDRFSQELAKRVSDFKVGYGLDDGVTIGPLVSEGGADKVGKHVEGAVSTGSKVLVGGHRGEGLFYEPTVVVSSENQRQPPDEEETFGPLATLYRFSNDDDVVKRANDVKVGLGAYFFTQDVKRAFRVGEALQVGMVGINTGAISQATIPFGGVRESGFGREGGPFGIEEYLYEKTLVFNV